MSTDRHIINQAKAHLAAGLLCIFVAWAIAAWVAGVELHRRYTAPAEYVTNHEINIFEGGSR